MSSVIPSAGAGHGVVVVGSTNVDVIVLPDETTLVAGKGFADVRRCVGGGGVNVACRLASAGIPVAPILGVGDDEGGRQAQAAISSALARGDVTAPGVRELVSDASFRMPDLATPLAVVVVRGGEREIFAEEPKTEGRFKPFLWARLAAVDRIAARWPRSVVLGHVPEDTARWAPTEEASATYQVVRQFAEACPIVWNPGRSQIQRRAGFWARTLAQVSVLVLSLDEARLLGETGLAAPLTEAVASVRRLGVATILTLGADGAVGIVQGRDEVLAIPALLRADEVVDTTGAGDALTAGVAASLLRQELAETAISDPERWLARCLGVGSLWAAQACARVGAADECPDELELERFAVRIGAVEPAKLVAVRPVAERVKAVR